MKTYNTYLPIFNGFYNSIFEADGEESEIEHINEEREKIDLEPIDYDDCEWDYKEYNLRVSHKCVEVIDEALNDILDMDMKITFESLQSPKYYNFSTDSINVEIEIDNLDVILEYLEKEKENFAKYIKERYTSCDGFMSFQPNDSNVWIEELKEEHDLGHKLGSVLDFILVNEKYETLDLYNGLDGENYITAKNYGELTIKPFPFNEGDDYYTIEDNDIIWSCWDDQSEELHTDDNVYFTTVAEAKSHAKENNITINKSL